MWYHTIVSSNVLQLPLHARLSVWLRGTTYRGHTASRLKFSGMTTPVRSRADVLERIREAEAEIRGLGVRRLALFGSFTRSEARADSDVDLLVEFAPGQKNFDRFTRLYDLLEERLARRVELVTTEALSPYIGPHILAEAEDVVPAA